jgi:NAD(P)-dependent dehydrogenase (short-subunit alcohol dehydrogenase family)
MSHLVGLHACRRPEGWARNELSHASPGAALGGLPYRWAMRSLETKTVLVTGVTGEVGWGLAHAAQAAGARLVLPVRSAAQVVALEAEFGAQALVAPVSFTDEGSLASLRDTAVAKFGAIDHAFSPLGAWWAKGASLDQHPEELRALYDVYVEAPWQLLRALSPALRSSAGSFTFVTGAGGEAPYLPNSGLLVAAVAAQLALARVLRHELRREPFRVNEIRISARLEREARPGVVPSREAGAAFLEVATGDLRGALLRYGADRALVTTKEP